METIGDTRGELEAGSGTLKAKIANVRSESSDVEARLYRQLWIMAAGIVGLTVALVKLLG